MSGEVVNHAAGGFLSMLGNPIVLIGGAALGAILLLRQPSAGSAGNSGAAAAYGTASAAASAAYAQVEPAMISAQVQMNTAALGAEVAKVQILSGAAVANYSQDTTRQANVISGLEHLSDNATTVQVQRIQSNAGVLQSQITTAGAVQMDAQQNNARLGMAWIDSATTLGVANAGLATAESHDASADQQAYYQLQGVKAAAKASTIGSIVGGVLGTAAIAGKAFA